MYIDVTSEEAQQRAIFNGIPYTVQEGKEIVKYYPKENNKREIIQVLDKPFVTVEKKEYTLSSDYNYVINDIKKYNDYIIPDIHLYTIFQGITKSLGIRAEINNLNITYYFPTSKILCIKNDKVIQYELRTLIKNLLGELIMQHIEETYENNN